MDGMPNIPEEVAFYVAAGNWIREIVLLLEESAKGFVVPDPPKWMGMAMDRTLVNMTLDGPEILLQVHYLHHMAISWSRFLASSPRDDILTPSTAMVQRWVAFVRTRSTILTPEDLQLEMLRYHAFANLYSLPHL